MSLPQDPRALARGKAIPATLSLHHLELTSLVTPCSVFDSSTVPRTPEKSVVLPLSSAHFREEKETGNRAAPSCGGTSSGSVSPPLFSFSLQKCERQIEGSG